MELKLNIEQVNSISLQCSNRTFMELKLLLIIVKLKRDTSSNRTFMELKLPIESSSGIG